MALIMDKYSDEYQIDNDVIFLHSELLFHNRMEIYNGFRFDEHNLMLIQFVHNSFFRIVVIKFT